MLKSTFKHDAGITGNPSVHDTRLPPSHPFPHILVNMFHALTNLILTAGIKISMLIAFISSFIEK